MKFITRRTEHKDLDQPSTHVEQVLHITEQAMGSCADAKSPYCRNGGMLLRMWRVIELDPRAIHYSHVCGACRRRLAANDIDVGLLP